MKAPNATLIGEHMHWTRSFGPERETWMTIAAPAPTAGQSMTASRQIIDAVWRTLTAHVARPAPAMPDEAAQCQSEPEKGRWASDEAATIRVAMLREAGYHTPRDPKPHPWLPGESAAALEGLARRMAAHCAAIGHPERVGLTRHRLRYILNEEQDMHVPCGATHPFAIHGDLSQAVTAAVALAQALSSPDGEARHHYDIPASATGRAALSAMLEKTRETDAGAVMAILEAIGMPTAMRGFARGLGARPW